MTVTPLWAAQAWVDGRWRRDVLLEPGTNGCWARVSPDTRPPEAATRLAGPALPGLVNAHGHAFQRAFAGLTERRAGAHDDFWSWRDGMYRVANAVTPATLRAIAAHLYVELLAGGYTHVCEFHYLRHDLDGQPYADPMALAQALAEAAVDAGIGITLLPVIYERAGFAAEALRNDQRRFRATADDVWSACQAFRRRAPTLDPRGRLVVDAGMGVHSLRAARPASIAHLLRLAKDDSGPLHVHVAEQRAEVADCLAATGHTPIAWLAAHDVLDARWHLVHATHTTPAEIAAVGRAGASVVLCPSTEANLGDGLPDLPAWLEAGVGLSVGSDSHATRCWREEVRWMEYGQRLRLERRNVAADGAAPDGGNRGTAGDLFERLCAGGGRAAGHAAWGLRPGARADLLVADPDDAALAGVPEDRVLDALVFSSPSRPWRDVMVAGRWAVQDGRHGRSAELQRAYAHAVTSCRADDPAA